MRRFNPDKPFGHYVSPEEHLIVQYGALFTLTGEFVRVGDGIEYAKYEPAGATETGFTSPPEPMVPSRKPFNSMNIPELQRELEARGIPVPPRDKGQKFRGAMLAALKGCE
jgi:hypothetical protein